MNGGERRGGKTPAPLSVSRRWFLAGLAALPAAPVLARSNGFTIEGRGVQGGWLRGTAPVGTVGLTLNGQPVPLAETPAEKERFFLAFDRDAGPAHHLVATLADGAVRILPLTVEPRAWRIEHVNTPLRPGKLPDAQFQRIRDAELQRIRAARAVGSAAQGWRQDFAWPANGRISGRFGSQRIYQGKPGAYHSGLDIAGPVGTPFAAPADGVVVLAAAAPFTLEGLLLMVDHGMGLNSAFLHCSAIVVKEGDSVSRGQPIGRIGATGRATGPHLHWSMKWRESRLDPLLFLDGEP